MARGQLVARKMADLQERLIDRDLVSLDGILDDATLPQRDWEAIIKVYNQNNKPFPISANACTKIIQMTKDGLKPNSIFNQIGKSYSNFINRYNKNKALLEDFNSKGDLTDNEWQIVRSLRNDPFYILGEDIKRVRAFHFNELQNDLKEISKMKAETFLTYMKEFHSEEFDHTQEKQGIEVTINFGEGILESI